MGFPSPPLDKILHTPLKKIMKKILAPSGGTGLKGHLRCRNVAARLAMCDEASGRRPSTVEDFVEGISSNILQIGEVGASLAHLPPLPKKFYWGEGGGVGELLAHLPLRQKFW